MLQLAFNSRGYMYNKFFLYTFLIFALLSYGSCKVEEEVNIVDDSNSTSIHTSHAPPSAEPEKIEETAAKLKVEKTLVMQDSEYPMFHKNCESSGEEKQVYGPLIERCLGDYIMIPYNGDISHFVNSSKTSITLNISNIPFNALKCFLEDVFLAENIELIRIHIDHFAEIIDFSGQLLGASPNQTDRITTIKLLEFIDDVYDLAAKSLNRQCTTFRGGFSLTSMIDSLEIVEEAIKPRIYRPNLESLKTHESSPLNHVIDQDIKDGESICSSTQMHSIHGNDTCSLLDPGNFLYNPHEYEVCPITNFTKCPNDIDVPEIHKLFLRPSKTLEEKQFRAMLYSMFIFDGIESSESFYEALSWNDFLQIAAYIMFDMKFDKSGSLIHHSHLERTLGDLLDRRIIIGRQSSNPFNFDCIRSVFYSSKLVDPASLDGRTGIYDPGVPLTTFSISHTFHSQLFIHMIKCYFFYVENYPLMLDGKTKRLDAHVLKRTFNMELSEFQKLSPLDQATSIARGFVDAEIYSSLNATQLFRILEYMVHLDSDGSIFSRLTADLMHWYYHSNIHVFKPFAPEFITAVKTLLSSEIPENVLSEFMSFFVPIRDAAETLVNNSTKSSDLIVNDTNRPDILNTTELD